MKKFGPASVRQRDILMSKVDITLAGGAAGSGKALRHGEKVLCETGWKNIEDVQVGDKVITPKNTIETVTGVYSQGSVKIYRVHFEDGRSVDTCKDHLWKVYRNDSPFYEVLSTEIIKNNKRHRYAVPLVLPIGNIELTSDKSRIYFFQRGVEFSSTDLTETLLDDVPSRLEFIKGYLSSNTTGEVQIDSFSIYLKDNQVNFIKYVMQSLGLALVKHKYKENNYCILNKNLKVLDLNFSSITGTTLDITSVEDLEIEDECTCISISGEDSLFITTDFICTHNTYILLLTALRFMQDPAGTGIIFRKTNTDLENPGGIWDEAKSMYSEIYGNSLKIKEKGHEIIFPNGAKLKFSHLQLDKDKYNHKGGQYSFVAFDEVTDFSEDVVIYLISRMRNAKVKHSPQMFLTTNPDYNHFTREWIQDYYLDPSTGIPDPDKAGKIMYTAMIAGKRVWYKTLEEAQSVHGYGPESGVRSFTFWPATCRDNPPLLKAQPDYISNLMSLPRVEMERLLLGSWFARQESAGYFKRAWCKLVPFSNPNICQRVRAWDLAFTKPSEVNMNPDWTRGILFSKERSNSKYTVEDLVSMRDRVHEVERLIFETAIRDGQSVVISIPQDPAAAAGAYAKDLQRRLAERGFTVRLAKPVKSKVTRFAPFSSVAQAGYVDVVQSDWNKEFFDELEIFDGDPKKKDDIVDTCSDAFLMLNKELQIPDMTFTDFSIKSDSVPVGIDWIRQDSFNLDEMHDSIQSRSVFS